MSEKTIGTNVIVVSVNHLSEDEQEGIMEKYDADSLQ